MKTSRFETESIPIEISKDHLLVTSISKHRSKNGGSINIYLINKTEDSINKLVNIKIINGKIIIGEKINERL